MYPSASGVLKVQSHPLPIMLDVAVPLRIHEIRLRGGPMEADFERARAFAPVLAEKGDVLLFGSKKEKGKAAELFNELAFALAVMAHVPGGITIFGNHKYKRVLRRMLQRWITDPEKHPHLK